jgi:hypothetical protein
VTRRDNDGSSSGVSAVHARHRNRRLSSFSSEVGGIVVVWSQYASRRNLERDRF